MESRSIVTFLDVRLEAVEEGGRLVRISRAPDSARHLLPGPLAAALQQQLQEAAEGTRKALDLPCRLEADGMELEVFRAISRIGYGETVSYSELAAMSGFPAAIRRVATICGKNPLPLLIPCHRVIRKDGRAGGYNLGPEFKERLLLLERENVVR